MINKILGKRIFKGKDLESISTICKIRNSDNIRVITEKVSGEREEQDFTGECDLDIEEGVILLRDFLEKRTDLTCMSSDDNIRCVDIGFPIHFLKVHYTYTFAYFQNACKMFRHLMEIKFEEDAKYYHFERGIVTVLVKQSFSDPIFSML